MGYNVHMAAAYGLGFKTGTPQEILDVVEAAVIRASKKAEMVESFQKIGLGVKVMTGKEYRAYWTGIENVVGDVVKGMAVKK